MRFTKLTALLRELSPTQKKRFGGYLHSPFFNTPPTAVALYEYLLSIHGTFPEKDLSPQAIAERKPLLKTESIQNKAGTQLLGCYENFLAAAHFADHHTQPALHKLAALKAQGYFEQFEEELQAMRQMAEGQLTKTISYFELQHQLAELQYNGFDNKLKRKQGQHIQPVLDTLDTYYAIKKIRYLCEALNRGQMQPSAHITTTAAPLLAQLSGLQHHPYIYLFTHVFGMLGAETFDDSTAHYQQIKKHIEAATDAATDTSIREVSDYLQAWSIKWMNKGHQQAAHEYLHWIRYKARHGWLLQHGLIEPAVYTNVLAVMVRTRQPADDIERFITQYTPALPAAIQQSRSTYAQAILLYAQAQYADAAMLFSQAEAKDDPVFNSIIRRWFFISTFESRPWGYGLDVILNTYARYINRNEALPDSIKEVFRQFISHSQKLLHSPLKHERQQLKTLIENQPYFPGKEWVIEKVAA